MPPAAFRPSAKPLSGRYLSLAEREEIALLLVQGHGVCEIARRLRRAGSTISREIRRNAATRSGSFDYRATTAQWHAERAARRPKVARGALARLAIVRRGAGVSTDQVLVTFPNGETRRMKPGPSSEITKAVVEVFAPTFLTDPAVVFLSESGNKVVARDDELARSIGLAIQADKNPPDTILVDLGPAHPLLVFMEVVATDGPISQRRKEALEELVAEAGFPAEHVAFVTAYLDRSAGPFKKTVDSLAWGSYAWFAAEPERLVVFSETSGRLRGRS